MHTCNIYITLYTHIYVQYTYAYMLINISNHIKPTVEPYPLHHSVRVQRGLGTNCARGQVHRVRWVLAANYGDSYETL